MPGPAFCRVDPCSGQPGSSVSGQQPAFCHQTWWPGCGSCLIELMCLWAVSGSCKLLAPTQLSCLRQWARLYLLSPFLQIS